jgi:acyl-CoA thioesterase-1
MRLPFMLTVPRVAGCPRPRSNPIPGRTRMTSPVRVPRRALLLGSLASFLLGCVRRDSAADAAPKPLTYVAIGASDTVGVGAGVPETESWPAVLWRRLPPGSKLVNLGISGSLVRQARTQQVPVAVDAHPDLVTVWLSVNDYIARVPLDQYAADLDGLLAALRDGTDAPILVGNVPDLGALPIAARLDLRDVDRWNTAIAEIVARHQATLVDLRGTWREVADHPDYISADGFHPSTSGYRRLADVFYDVAAEQVGLSSSNG